MEVVKKDNVTIINPQVYNDITPNDRDYNHMSVEQSRYVIGIAEKLIPLSAAVYSNAARVTVSRENHGYIQGLLNDTRIRPALEELLGEEYSIHYLRSSDGQLKRSIVNNETKERMLFDDLNDAFRHFQDISVQNEIEQAEKEIRKEETQNTADNIVSLANKLREATTNEEAVQILSEIANNVNNINESAFFIDNRKKENTSEEALPDQVVQAESAHEKKEKTFAEQIHEVLHGTPNRYDDLKVCDTPKILQYIGCDDLPMLYTKEHLRKAVKPKDVHKHQHGLTEEFLATVPELMAEPVMVLDSMTRDDSLLVVLSSKETDPDNAPIVASVFPNGQGKYEMQLMPSNYITSIYGRDNFETFINKCAEEDKILFADKEKSQELFSVLRLQFPQGFNNLSFNTIIHPSRNIVKGFEKSIPENEQISEPVQAESAHEKTFAEQVDEVISGIANRYDDIKVCDTPKVLMDIGLEHLPMLYSQKHLRKAVAARNEAAHTHGLDVEQVKRMAELLADPVMILDSITRDDTVIAVTDMLDDKNSPVIISIRPNGKGHYELEEVDSNFVTSMYGKDNFESFLNRSIEQDKVLYVSNNKSQELFRVLTLQLGKGVNILDFANLGSNTIIHQSRNIVKPFVENTSDNEQISEPVQAESAQIQEGEATGNQYQGSQITRDVSRKSKSGKYDIIGNTNFRYISDKHKTEPIPNDEAGQELIRRLNSLDDLKFSGRTSDEDIVLTVSGQANKDLVESMYHDILREMGRVQYESDVNNTQVDNRVQSTEHSGISKEQNNSIDIEKAKTYIDDKKENLSFSEQVDAVLENRFDPYSALKVSDTPDILLGIGCEQLPILYTQQHLRNALHEENENNHRWHGLTIAQVKAMPDYISSPAMILDSLTRDDSIVIISESIDNKNRPIIVTIKPDGRGMYGVEEVDSNFVTSLYGRNGFERFVMRAIKQNKVLYADKKKTEELFKFQGLQLPEAFNNLPFDTIIHPSRNIVKPFVENISDNEQISEPEQSLSAPKAENPGTAPQNRAAYTIYQLPDGEKYHGIRFESSAQLAKEGIYLNEDDYDEVYSGEIDLLNDPTKYKNSFAEQIHEVLHGTPDRYVDLKVCNTPKALQDVGCDDLPMFYTKNHLKKAVMPKDRKKHQHGLTEDFLSNVPEFMADPVMILDSITRDDSLLVVLSSKETDPDNAPIVASVFPNGQGKYEMQLMPSNFITSIYGRDDFGEFINKCVEQDKVLFANKEKSQELFSVLRLEFSQGFNNLSFDTIIHQSRNIVKGFEKNNSDGLPNAEGRKQEARSSELSEAKRSTDGIKEELFVQSTEQDVPDTTAASENAGNTEKVLLNSNVTRLYVGDIIEFGGADHNAHKGQYRVTEYSTLGTSFESADGGDERFSIYDFHVGSGFDYSLIKSHSEIEAHTEEHTHEAEIEKQDKRTAAETPEKNIPELSQEDIEILRQLEPRKSILNFTDDEIKLTEKWQERFTDIGEKSPYYRIQNGDWRESENSIVPIISVIGRNADFNTVSDDIKEKVIYRGVCRNSDTDWDIQISRRGLEDSLTYARQHNDTALYQMMYNVRDLVQNSVMLDTVISEKNNANKANNTAFMHKLYSVCRVEDEPYLAKISVEEFIDGNKDTRKRLYNVQDIKIEPLRHAAFTDKQLALSVLNGTDISISDLFKAVKSFDKDFYLNKRNAAETHEKIIPELSQEDIEILRQLEPRKSILNFSEDEIKLTEKWLDRFTDIGEKSPYYRAQNGDWRENEQAQVKILKVDDHGKDFKGVRDDIKNNIIERGIFTNFDTGWEIQVSRHGLEDSVKHGVSKNDVETFALLYHVKELVENSILLDSVVSEDNNDSKAFNTAFMHKLYSPVLIDNSPCIAKLTVEEFGNSATKNTQNRLYNVRDIKIEPAENIGFTNGSLARSFSDGSSISISDLFKAVKSFDKDFYLNKRNAAETHEIIIPELSQEDIEILKQLEPRKSVLNFTDDEIKLAEKWLDRFTDIGEKSPYYRLQNGDWRENEQAQIKILKVGDHGKDFKGVRDDIKNNIIERGIFTNSDTGWEIQVSRHGLEDTVAYGQSYHKHSTYDLLYNIKDFVENGVLLDSIVSEDNNNSKAYTTAFMHKLYCPCTIENEPHIAKITVEEYGVDNTTKKRLYNIREIEIKTAEDIGFTNDSLRHSFLNGSTISISDLFKAVKSFDKDFYLNKRNAAETHERKTHIELGDKFRDPTGAIHEVTDLNGSPYPDYFGDVQVVIRHYDNLGGKTFAVDSGIDPSKLLDPGKYEFIGNDRSTEERAAAREQAQKKEESANHEPDIGDVYLLYVSRDGKRIETYGTVSDKYDTVDGKGSMFTEFYRNDECSKSDRRMKGRAVSVPDYKLKDGSSGEYIGNYDDITNRSNQFSLFEADTPHETRDENGIKVGDKFETGDSEHIVTEVGDTFVKIETSRTGEDDNTVITHSEVSKADIVNDGTFVGNTFDTAGEVLANENAESNDDISDSITLNGEEKVNFRIENDDFNTAHGKKTRYNLNIEAIKTLKQIEQEERFATPEEQEILSHYVGWGGIGEAFDSRLDNWAEEYKELKELLTPEEYNNAASSTENAHYTSPVVIKSIYKALENMGFEGGKILEPSCGTGNFLGCMPEEMFNRSKITGVELDSITGRIAQQLYQSANIQVKGFERTRFRDGSFDVAVSNVPFSNSTVNDLEYKNNKTVQKMSTHNYFFAKALDKVHEGGIVAFVTSSFTMDSKNKTVREYLAGKADFLGAVRLPNNAFKDIAGTEVTTDIIFLQKRDTPKAVNEKSDPWIGLGSVEIPDPNYKKPEMEINVNKSEYGYITYITSSPVLKVGDTFKVTDKEQEYILKIDSKRISRSRDVFSVKVTDSDGNDITKDSDTIRKLGFVPEKVYEYTLSNLLWDNTSNMSKDESGNIIKESGKLKDNVEYLGNEFEKAPETISVSINSYFAEHPEMILGNIELGNKPYGRSGDSIQCTAKEGVELSDLLAKAVDDGIKGEYRKNKTEKEIDETAEEIEAPYYSVNNSYIIQNDTLYFRGADITMKKCAVDKKNKDEPWGFESENELQTIKELTVIKDETLKLLDCQTLEATSDDAVQDQIDKVNSLLDDFVDKHGNLYVPKKKNKSSKNTDQKEVEEEETPDAVEIEVAFKKLKNDCACTTVCNLQNFNDNGEYAGKADCLKKRVILPTREITYCETSKDALVVSLSEKLKVDLDYMARLTGFSKDKLIDDLKGEIYQDPEKDMQWEDKGEYLSGDIYKKIDAAQEAGLEDNLKALDQVLPTRLEADNINVNLGCTWVEPSYIKKFMVDFFQLSYSEARSLKVEYCRETDLWHLEYEKNSYNTNVTDKYGVKNDKSSVSAYKLIENILNLKPTKVEYKVTDAEGNIQKKFDAEGTKEAENKTKLLRSAYASWIFSDPERKEILVDRYNRLFNAEVERKFDGSHLRFTGMNKDITLRDHQKDAIARCLIDGNTLIAHEVGAGKTFTMAAIAIEGKRLGLHNKPLITVPKSLTAQVGSDIQKLYPNAKILVVGEDDFTKERRKNLISKAALNDWDAIVLAHSQFDKITVSKERIESYINKDAEALEKALAAAVNDQGSSSFSAKQIKARVKKLKGTQKKIFDKIAKDDFISFEELGVDKLFIDEAHKYKNIAVESKMGAISGINQNTADRALLHKYKCAYMNEKTGENGIVLSTGTPVSNSLSEIYPLMMNLMPSYLKEKGIDTFDRFVADFGEVITDDQIKPDNSGFQLRSRLGKFKNAVEFHALFRKKADIKTSDSLNLDVPDAERHIVEIKSTRRERKVVKTFGDRADKIKNKEVEPTEDNMLKITTDGRKLGLDLRCLDADAPDLPNSKINTCVENVARIYNDNAETKGTQLIFCDMATPKAKENENEVTLYKSNGSYTHSFTDTLPKNSAGDDGFRKLIKRISENKDWRIDLQNALKSAKEEGVEDTDEIFKKYTPTKVKDMHLEEGDIILRSIADRDTQQRTNTAFVYSNGTFREADLAEYSMIGRSTTEEYIPKNDFCAYTDIKEKLIAKGIPAREIEFIHDAETNEEKLAMFRRMNEGTTRVLIGSTEKCGAGMNAQKHMVALHHLDVPMKPSDFTQREGRILRQGNENKKVDIYQYIKEGTYDAYLYQMLLNKQKFVSQIFTEKITDRTIDDIDQIVLDFETAKAVAVGNPLIREHIELKRKVDDLLTEQSIYFKNKFSMESQLNSLPKRISNAEENIRQFKNDFQKAQNAPKKSISDDKGNIIKDVYPITVGGKNYSDGNEAGKAIRDFIISNVADILNKPVSLGQYRGMELLATPCFHESGKHNISLCLKGEQPHYSTALTPPNPYNLVEGEEIFKESGNPSGFITRLDNVINNMDKKINIFTEEKGQLEKNYITMQKDVNMPFDKEEELSKKQQRLIEVTNILEKTSLSNSYEYTLFKSMTELCPDLLTSNDLHLTYLVKGDDVVCENNSYSSSFMPLTIEKHGDTVYISHDYEQNGDLMSDPLVVMKLDSENSSAILQRYRNDGIGVDQMFSRTIQEIEKTNKDGEVEVDIKEIISDEEKSCADFMETWFDNIENQMYVPVAESDAKDFKEYKRNKDRDVSSSYNEIGGSAAERSDHNSKGISL